MKGMIEGDWDESGIQLDYFTISQLINKCRELGYDMDDLINCGLAINCKSKRVDFDELQ